MAKELNHNNYRRLVDGCRQAWARLQQLQECLIRPFHGMGNALPANIYGATDEERDAETQQRQQELLKRIDIGQWMTVVVPLRSNGSPNWRTLTAF